MRTAGQKEDGPDNRSVLFSFRLPDYHFIEKMSSSWLFFSGFARNALHPASRALTRSESKALALIATIRKSALN